MPKRCRPPWPGGSTSSHLVKVSGLGFEPSALTVHEGERITWENTDLIVHTVTGGAFDSGDLAAGRSWTWVAERRGTFNYACRYHPNMKGTLVVQPERSGGSPEKRQGSDEGK